MSLQPQIKTIGINGQISLGKEFAGKMVLIDQINEGTWVIKVGQFVPDSERWLHEAQQMTKLDRALDWAEKNPPQNNLDQLIQDFENDSHQN